MPAATLCNIDTRTVAAKAEIFLLVRARSRLFQFVLGGRRVRIMELQTVADRRSVYLSLYVLRIFVAMTLET